jgi:hypothetical protein
MAKNLFLEEDEDHLNIFPKTLVKRDVLGIGDAMSLIHRCNNVLKPQPPPVIHSTVSNEFEGLSFQDLKTDTMAWLSRQRQFKPIEPTSKSTNIDIQMMLLRASRIQVGLQRERNLIDYAVQRHPAYTQTYREIQQISDNLEQNRERPLTLGRAIGDITGSISGLINKITPVVSGLGLQSIFFSYFVTNYVGLTAIEAIAAAVAVNIIIDLPKSYRAVNKEEQYEGRQSVLMKLYQAMARSTTTTLCVTSVYQIAGLVFTGGYLIIASAVIPVIGRLLFSKEYGLNQVKTVMKEAQDEAQLREEALGVYLKNMELFFFQHGGRAQSAFAKKVEDIFGFVQQAKVYLAAIPFVSYRILYEQLEPFRNVMDGLKVAVNVYAEIRNAVNILNPVGSLKYIFKLFARIGENTVSGFVTNYAKMFQSEEIQPEMLQEIQSEIDAVGGNSLFRNLIRAGKSILVYSKQIIYALWDSPFTTLLSLSLGIFFTDYLFSFSPESYGVLNFIVEGRNMLMGSVYSALYWTLGASDKSNIAILLSRVSRGGLSLLCFTSMVHGIENSAEYMYGVYEKLVNQTTWCQALCVGVMAAMVGCLNYNELVLQGVVPLFTSAIYFIKNYYMVLVPGATVALLQCCVNYLTYVASSTEALQFIYNSTLTVVSGGIMGVLRNHMGVYMAFMLPLLGTLFVNDMTGLELDAWKVMCVALFSGITTLGVVRWGGSTRFGIKVGQCVEILQEASLSKIFEEQSLYFKLHVFDSDLLETTFSSMLRFLYLEVYTKQKVDMIVRETAEVMQQPAVNKKVSQKVKKKLIEDDKKIMENKINEIDELLTNYDVYTEEDSKVSSMYIDMLINKKELLEKMHAEFKSLVRDEQVVGSHMTGILNKVMNEVAFWKPEQVTNNVEVMENIVEELNMILEDSAMNIKEANGLLKKLNNKGNILIGNVQEKKYVSTDKIEALRGNLNTVDEMIEARKKILQINDAKIDYLQTKIYNDLVAGAASFKDTDNVRKKFRENFVPNAIFYTLKSNVNIIRNKFDAAFGVTEYYEKKNIVRDVDNQASIIEAFNNYVESSGELSSKFPTEGELLLLTEINDEQKRLKNYEKDALSRVMIRNKQMSQEEKRLAVQSKEAGLADAIQSENQQADATQSENKQAGLELGAVQFQPQQAETLVEFARGVMKGNMNTQATRLTTLKQIISRRIEGRGASSVTTGNAWKTLTSFGGEEGGGSSGNRESKFISTPDNLPDRPEDVPEVLKEGMLGFYTLDGKLKSRLSNIFREGSFFNFFWLDDLKGLKEFPEFMAVYNKWLDKINQKENEGLLPKINAETLRKNLTFMGYDKDIKQQLEAIPLTEDKLKLVYTRNDQQQNIMREMSKRDKPNAADPGFLWSISEERAPPHVLDANDPFKGVRSRLIERVDDLLKDEYGDYTTMKNTIEYNIETLRGVVDQAIKSDFDQAVKKQHKMILGLYKYEQHHVKEVLWINEPPESRMSTFTDVFTGAASTVSSLFAHKVSDEISTYVGNIGDMLGISEARKLQIPIECGPAFIGKKAWNSPEVHRGCQIIANQQYELLEYKSRMVEVEVTEPLNVLTGGLSFAAYMVNKLPDYNPDIDNRYIPKPEWVILDNLQFDKDNLLENFDYNFETTDDFNILYLNKGLDTNKLSPNSQ